jgi:FixJ family two-component response regulator
VQAGEGAILTGTVHIIEDEAVQAELRSCFISHGLCVRTYLTAEEFLEAYSPAHPECLISGVRLAGMDGIDLLKHLIKRELQLPVILITAESNVLLAVQAIKLGAFDFIEKPLNEEMLMLRMSEALARDAKASIEDEKFRTARRRLATLSAREHDLLGLLMAGLSSKQAAIKLSISIKTVSNHRAHLLAKMNAANTAELIRMAMLGDEIKVPKQS